MTDLFNEIERRLIVNTIHKYTDAYYPELVLDVNNNTYTKFNEVVLKRLEIKKGINYYIPYYERRYTVERTAKIYLKLEFDSLYNKWRNNK